MNPSLETLSPIDAIAVEPRGAAPTTQPVILVGNPNVGKSVLFSKLTGRFVIISNYPGTTVEVSRGKLELDQQPVEVIDTPGVNQLAVSAEDARVTCNVLADYPDATVLQVADAKNLRRALLLTFQLQAQGRALVLAVNMMDELDRCGGKLDLRVLSEELGIPVVPTIAIAGTGIHLVQKTLAAQRRAENQRSASADKPAARPQPPSSDVGRVDLPGQPPDAVDQTESTEALLQRANAVLAKCYSITRPHRPTFAQRLGWWATHPVKGLFLVGLILYFTFWFVGLFGAGTAVDFLETVVFQRYVSPAAIQVVDALIPFPHEHAHEMSHYVFELPLSPAHSLVLGESATDILAPAYSSEPDAMSGWWTQTKRLAHDFLVGEYGLITMALSYALAIVLPIVTTFFLLFSMLEDSGYLSRLAVMLNRIFRGMGLNGKAVLPMVLGLGCDTMATMTTRILDTRKERVITTLLLALAVPCSAQLGVLLAMMASVSWPAALFWVGLMAGLAFLIGWLAARLTGGTASDFILELPPMRRPQLGNVVTKTVARMEWYLKEVIPLFMIGTAVLFVLDRLRVLDWLARVTEPLVTGWLGLPAETANAFLIGFMRRDFGAVYLLDAATGTSPVMTSHQILVAMVTITLFMPCIATLFMIAKELGRKTAFWITVFIFPFAFLVGGLVHRLGLWIGL